MENCDRGMCLSVGENNISYWVRRRDNKITGTDTKMSWTIGCDEETDGKCETNHSQEERGRIHCRDLGSRSLRCNKL